MDDGGGDGGGNFKVKHGSDAAEVTNVHEAEAGEASDVVGQRETRIKLNMFVENHICSEFIEDK